MTPSPPAGSSAAAAARGAADLRARRAARVRWSVAIAVAALVHGILAGFTRVELAAKPRHDVINPRVTWAGDRVLLAEDTLQGQQFAIFDDTSLFLVTRQNFAGMRSSGEETRPPGQIFGSFEPILVMPTDGSPPGLVAAPTDRVNPTIAVQSFRWPFFERFGRDDPVERVFEARRARVEVRSVESGTVVLSDTIPPDPSREAPEVWPDWRPFDLFVSVAEGGRLSEPLVLGGSGSDAVDRFMREHVRRTMRLDLRLGPGSYRISIGP